MAQEKPDKSACNGIWLTRRINVLAQKINCLDMGKIADICVTEVPKILQVRFASLYTLDETNSILHLQKHNHPFPINKIVSLNQISPSPMVMAVRSKELILVGNINISDKPIIKKSQRPFAKNYSTNNCAIIPLDCQNRVVGVLNLADKIEGGSFDISFYLLLFF